MQGTFWSPCAQSRPYAKHWSILIGQASHFHRYAPEKIPYGINREFYFFATLFLQLERKLC